MTPELQNLILLWNKLSAADKYTFQKNVQIFDGHNIILGTSTGTSIGTSATQKLSLYGVTPIVQQGSISNPSGGATVDGQARGAINAIIATLKNMGITA